MEIIEETMETVESLKECGDVLYKEKKYLEAIDFYSRALGRIDDTDSISSLLLNFATVTMKLDSSTASARLAVAYAASALVIVPGYEKAQIRLSNELRRLGEGRFILLDSKQQIGTDNLIAISDAMEGCIDELFARHGEVSEIKTDSTVLDEKAGGTALKAKGNELTTAGRHSDALMVYLSAIQTVSRTTGVASLLSNRAICHNQLEQHSEALNNAIGAICCDPLLLKAHFHRASALLGLGRSKKAQAAALCGLQIDSMNLALSKLSDQLTKLVTADGLSGGGGTTNGGTDSFIQGRLKKMLPNFNTTNKENEKKGMMNAREHQAANNQMEAIQGFIYSGTIDQKIPSFHIEFSTAEKWPVLCNILKCEDRLLMAYESGRGAGWFYFHYAISKQYEKKHLLKRLNAYSNFDGITSWFGRAQVGEINLNLNNKTIYDPRVLHGFANNPNRREELIAGTTVVSVGFTDLGVLREATLIDSRASLVSLPTRWVGYEASAYCVAKTAIIIGMLNLDANVDCILQVWYSAAWSSKTLVAFRQAVTLVLEGKTKLTGTSHPDVRVLLQTWQSEKVSLAHARNAWLDKNPDEIKWRAIGNFRRAADRKALCAYSISGQLLEATMGSVVMFVLPPGYMGCLAVDEQVFECISSRYLLDRCRTGASDIVTATIAHLREGITKLLEWVLQGSLIMDVRLCALDPDDKASLASVAALDPHTITWSNVCDYYPAKDFHDMARGCSGNNTVHHAYR